jgi:hypothetical protein
LRPTAKQRVASSNPAWRAELRKRAPQDGKTEAGAYCSEAVNRPHASTLKASVPPSRLVVSRTRTTGPGLATSTQFPPPEPE